MERRITFASLGGRALGISAILLGAAGATGIALAAPAVAATPASATTISVYPPDSPDGDGAPDPITGVATGQPVLVTVGVASSNTDFSASPAPTGTISLTDSQGLITQCAAGEFADAAPASAVPLEYSNLLFSIASCYVTFPVGTSGPDVLTATYAGDGNNAGSVGTNTIDFPGGPPAATPETPVTVALPLAAIAVGGGVIGLRRRRRAHMS